MNVKACNVKKCLSRKLLHSNRCTVTQLLSFHFEWFIYYVSGSEREEKSDTFGHFTDILNDSYNLVCTSIVKTRKRVLLYKTKFVACGCPCTSTWMHIWVQQTSHTDVRPDGLDRQIHVWPEVWTASWMKDTWLRVDHKFVTDILKKLPAPSLRHT